MNLFSVFPAVSSEAGEKILFNFFAAIFHFAIFILHFALERR
jgi:hypothetical protein